MWQKGRMTAPSVFLLVRSLSYYSSPALMTSSKPSYVPEPHLQIPSLWGRGLSHVNLGAQFSAWCYHYHHPGKEIWLLLVKFRCKEMKRFPPHPTPAKFHCWKSSNVHKTVLPVGQGVYMVPKYYPQVAFEPQRVKYTFALEMCSHHTLRGW